MTNTSLKWHAPQGDLMFKKKKKITTLWFQAHIEMRQLNCNIYWNQSLEKWPSDRIWAVHTQSFESQQIYRKKKKEKNSSIKENKTIFCQWGFFCVSSDRNPALVLVKSWSSGSCGFCYDSCAFLCPSFCDGNVILILHLESKVLPRDHEMASKERSSDFFMR